LSEPFEHKATPEKGLAAALTARVSRWEEWVNEEAVLKSLLTTQREVAEAAANCARVRGCNGWVDEEWKFAARLTWPPLLRLHGGMNATQITLRRDSNSRRLGEVSL
jgi:hypothetical protein